MSTVGERLRLERQRLNLSQEELGSRGGVRKQAQLNYEKGERAPDTTYLLAVAEAGVDVVFVLTGRKAEGEAISMEAARIAAGQAYRASQALGGDLTAERFEKLFLSLCDTTAAREEAAASPVPEPEVTGVHKVVQKIGAGSHNVQIGHGQLVTSEAPSKVRPTRKKTVN
ncbi:helix-turn-helix domain-containing protein [Cupriavidus pinatubonensis]|uniref:helix-turn-helix domain-containing protein n=1 Tax=Cupriavidus pinatubonensis TaxID=248026 RepID=UPI00360EB694